jgi:protein-L-isoaspartate(D-aspartate) O-methyltransferase
MSIFEKQRQQMVDRQIVSRGVSDTSVLKAMREVPREMFVPDDMSDFAYEDSPLPIEQGQTISQPYIVALMAEALELGKGDRVLEVGAGSGYAAAVLSRIADKVYAIERYPELAESAAKRARNLGYDNISVCCGDGTLGWSEHAPFDAIIVAAGGPEVPESLLNQLKIGGRLVIPVGEDMRTQELLRIVRTAEHKFEYSNLGKVQFVPLIGSEGWAVDGTPVEARRASKPLRIAGDEVKNLSALIAANCEPFSTVAEADLQGVIRRIGDARVVLIGEASHGTSEFYRMRARITRELIVRRGFNAVAIEGDYPDTSTIDAAIRGRTPPVLRTTPFSRFPTWMWNNEEMKAFLYWAQEFNRSISHQHRQVSIHGLDIYSLYNSIGVVLDFLDRVDPEAAESARVRYGCFSPWETDPATYGRAAVSGRLKGCEEEVVRTLSELLENRVKYALEERDELFDAERNATVVKAAERYYRIMYHGNRESWNLRDSHMFDTLEAVVGYRGPDARVVVWAHNSHVGYAPATEMGVRGELNIGQLARERWGSLCYNIGFGTHTGTVAAASNWDEPVQFMAVQPSHQDSYERLCHDTGIGAFFLPLRYPRSQAVKERLLHPHLERAIGVIYRPKTEILSHYFHAVLPIQFDEYIWMDETQAVTPIETPRGSGVPETYPFGL